MWRLTGFVFFFSSREDGITKCIETSQRAFSRTGNFSLDPPASCPLRKYTTQLANEKLGVSNACY